MNNNRDQISANTQKSPGEDAAQEMHGHGADQSRRRFSKLGLAAPVILSLVSKPVFGGGGGTRQCLSNMLSGNLSDPNRGACSKGWSPGAWKNKGGKISIYSTTQAWSLAGFSYEHSTTSTAPFPSLLSGAPANIRLSKYLSDNPGSLNAGIICAYLNARLSENTSGVFKYILTPSQVIGLVNGSIPVPPAYGSLHSFLYSTWQ